MPHAMQYPESPRVDVVDVLHGIDVPDPYRWLEDLDSPETRAWITAQNQLTYDYLDQIPARERLRKRIAELWNYERFGVPIKRGGRYFFTRNDGLQNQPVLYWLASLDGELRTLLDPNELSGDGTVALTGFEVSEDGRWLAYGLSSSGSDWQKWHVMEVDSGQQVAEDLEWVKFSRISWSKDHQGFYYSRYDAPADGLAYKGANYFHKLYYHRVGRPQSEDILVYDRPDQKEWGFHGAVTEDGRYLIISVWKGTHRENGIFYRDFLAGSGEVVELLNEFDAGYNFIGNDGSRFYLMTDRDAPMGRVVAIDIEHPDPENWEEIVPESGDSLESVRLIGNKLVATYLHNAHSRVQVYDLTGARVGEVALPGMGSVSGFGGRRADPETFFHFTSFTTPGTVYHYDVESGVRQIFRQPQLKFDPEEYVTRQVFYLSKDGTRIPMFLTYKKGLNPDPDIPAYLSGYGGFNISMTPEFSVSVLAWLEMGGLHAQANLRGGGEYGKPWHEAGMKLKKQNVFDDFIAAAEWLIEHKYTRSGRLVIGGGSNGGLLVAACISQRPDLFGACLPNVGVLDMLRFHKFTIGWAWTSDYGSPDDPEEFKALLAYSPYHNLEVGRTYPATLITTGDHDDRVFPAHSFKFAAALQAAQSGSGPVLIRIENKTGHGLGKPTEKIIEESADRWAFILAALRLDSDAD